MLLKISKILSLYMTWNSCECNEFSILSFSTSCMKKRWKKHGNSTLLNLVEKARNSKVTFNAHFQKNRKWTEIELLKILPSTNTTEIVWNHCLGADQYHFHASSMGLGLVGILIWNCRGDFWCTQGIRGFDVRWMVVVVRIWMEPKVDFSDSFFFTMIAFYA